MEIGNAAVDAYVKGGALGLLIFFLIVGYPLTYRYIVKTLWDELKITRQKLLEQTEKLFTSSEASRLANEASTKAVAEQSAAYREIASSWRNNK